MPTGLNLALKDNFALPEAYTSSGGVQLEKPFISADSNTFCFGCLPSADTLSAMGSRGGKSRAFRMRRHNFTLSFSFYGAGKSDVRNWASLRCRSLSFSAYTTFFRCFRSWCLRFFYGNNRRLSFGCHYRCKALHFRPDRQDGSQPTAAFLRQHRPGLYRFRGRQPYFQKHRRRLFSLWHTCIFRPSCRTYTKGTGCSPYPDAGSL